MIDAVFAEHEVDDVDLVWCNAAVRAVRPRSHLAEAAADDVRDGLGLAAVHLVATRMNGDMLDKPGAATPLRKRLRYREADGPAVAESGPEQLDRELAVVRDRLLEAQL